MKKNCTWSSSDDDGDDIFYVWFASTAKQNINSEYSIRYINTVQIIHIYGEI